MLTSLKTKFLKVLLLSLILHMEKESGLGTNDFYEKIGSTLKHYYQGCTVWLISSDLENMKYIGLNQIKK